jgi:two-component sensor histidine kinase
MAAIHRALYQEHRLTDLSADRVLDEIVRKLVALGTPPGRRVDMSCYFAPATLTAERMVPLSLLLTEVVTNAMQHLAALGPDQTPWIEISLAPVDPADGDGDDGAAPGPVELRVSNARRQARSGPDGQIEGAGHASEAGPQGAGDPDRVNSGLGLELIEAFAAQIDAEVIQQDEETARGPAWSIAVRFRPDIPTPSSPAGHGSSPDA